MNIWVNGCFDILHTGHLDLFWFAKLYGVHEGNYPEAMKTNTLYVGIDTDDRVRQLKGEGRPVNNDGDRGKILANLMMIDDVVVFHDDEELRYYIKELDIDYIIIGDDYQDKEVIGIECTKDGVVYYPKTDKSTTNIIEKIKNL